MCAPLLAETQNHKMADYRKKKKEEVPVFSHKPITEKLVL
jgi:hypothetical protein